MTKSEGKARELLKKMYPDAFIHKLADYKSSGSGANAGMPDYLVIYRGETVWYEVKAIKSVKTFNLKEINEFQWVILTALYHNGAKVRILIFDGKMTPYIVEFGRLYLLAKQNIKSLKFADLSL